MKRAYDFSNGERGKFYKKGAELYLLICLGEKSKIVIKSIL